MTQFIAAVSSIGAGATTFNLMGTLGVRTVSKLAPSYSGGILAGISSTAFFVLGHLTKENVFPDESENKEPKRALYIAMLTLVGGAALPHLLAPLSRSKVSLIASIAYSILGHFGTNFGLSVFSYFDDSTSFSESFNAFKEKHLEMWNYLTNSSA